MGGFHNHRQSNQLAIISSSSMSSKMSTEIRNWDIVAKAMEAAGTTSSQMYIRAKALAEGKLDPMPTSWPEAPYSISAIAGWLQRKASPAWGFLSLPLNMTDNSKTRFGFVNFAETWNGRMAMMGFIIGLSTELLTGQGILSQLGWFIFWLQWIPLFPTSNTSSDIKIWREKQNKILFTLQMLLKLSLSRLNLMMNYSNIHISLMQFLR